MSRRSAVAVAGLALACAALAGCGPSGPFCPGPGTVLATARDRTLTCAELDDVERWAVRVGGRELADGDSALFRTAILARWTTDPARGDALVEEARAVADEIGAAAGLSGAELRATRAWEATSDLGPLGELDDEARNVVRRTLSVWGRDDEERLVMTESDVEGWIRYASLCREAQGGGPLRLSIADRVPSYRTLRERFDGAAREDQIALVAVGGQWWTLRDSWRSADAEQQQAWVAVAPLPPPMTATSLGYFQAVIEGNAVAHAQAVEVVFGPLPVGGGR